MIVEVEYANITFVETQFRASRRAVPGAPLPMIPGNGVGGTVDGRRVIASLGGSGGYAERVAVDAAALFDVPDGMALDDAVALLADGRTATMLLRAAAIAPGDRVLVEAAAGGVGTQLVQLAKAAGATVIAAAGSAASSSWRASLGADEPSTTRATAGPRRRSTWSSTASAATIARAAFAQLVHGGRMLSYGLASGSWAGISAEEARRARRHAPPARPLTGGAALLHRERARRRHASDHRPALPARTRRRRPRGDRSPRDARQDPARGALSGRASPACGQPCRAGGASYPPTPPPARNGAPPCSSASPSHPRCRRARAAAAQAAVPRSVPSSRCRSMDSRRARRPRVPTMYGYETVECDDLSYPAANRDVRRVPVGVMPAGFAA